MPCSACRATAMVVSPFSDPITPRGSRRANSFARSDWQVLNRLKLGDIHQRNSHNMRRPLPDGPGKVEWVAGAVERTTDQAGAACRRGRHHGLGRLKTARRCSSSAIWWVDWVKARVIGTDGIMELSTTPSRRTSSSDAPMLPEQIDRLQPRNRPVRYTNATSSWKSWTDWRDYWAPVREAIDWVEQNRKPSATPSARAVQFAVALFESAQTPAHLSRSRPGQSAQTDGRKRRPAS